MRKDGIFKKVDKESKRVIWTPASKTFRVFFTTICFIAVLATIIFLFTIGVTAILDAIGV